MSDAPPITATSLMSATFALKLHCRLARGGFFRVAQCKEHPRLTVEQRRAEGGRQVKRTLLVDSKIVDTLDQVATLLNEAAK